MQPEQASGHIRNVALEDLVNTKPHEQKEVHDRPEKKEFQFIGGDVVKCVVCGVPLNNFPQNCSTEIKTRPKVEEECQVSHEA